MPHNPDLKRVERVFKCAYHVCNKYAGYKHNDVTNSHFLYKAEQFLIDDNDPDLTGGPKKKHPSIASSKRTFMV